MIYLISPETIPFVEYFALQLNEIFSLQQRPSKFQLRLKNQNNIEKCIECILPICKKYGVDFILNDDILLAKKYKVGVHVGRDIDIKSVQQFKNDTGFTIGVSCYNDLSRALQFAEFVDYVSFGAIFKSLTKPNATVCNKDIVTRFAKQSNKDIAIIGGINSGNLNEISEILPIIKYLCVISCIWNK